LKLECPITHEIMQEPVILQSTGHTYERAAIEQWLSQKQTDPLTGEEVHDVTLVPNYVVLDVLEEYNRLRSWLQKDCVTAHDDADD